MATNEELTLPKATVSKLIKEMLPDDMKCANDTRDLIVECCVEFIRLISSEANEVCAKDKKKTIAPEHILKSLQSLGFEDYHDPVDAAFQEYKQQSQGRPRGIKRLENQDIPDEVLLQQQQELFNRAKTALRISQQSDTSQEISLNDSMDLSASANGPRPSIVLSKYEPDETEEQYDEMEEDE